MSPPLLKILDPQPAASALPDRLRSPLYSESPSELLGAAALALQGELDELARGCGHELQAPGGGKMFGLLLARDAEGRIGVARAFSGMLGKSWTAESFVPPVLDIEAKESFWPEGAAELERRRIEIDALEHGPELLRAQQELHDTQVRHREELEALRARLRANKEQRRLARETARHRDALHEIDQQSRKDTADKRELSRRHRDELEPLQEGLSNLRERLRQLKESRAELSKGLMQRIHDTYQLCNPAGTRRPLRELFTPIEPPSGAADCAGAKLLHWANSEGLEILELCEFWWGSLPETGGRRPGLFYPSCRGKCGPLMPFLLEGLEVDEPAPYGAAAVSPSEPRVVYEDEWILVVDKPAGLLSQPGKDPRLGDSVLTRIAERYPEATGPLLVHRLDLDTSGLLLVAKDKDTHELLQRLFSRRKVTKRYIALVEARPPAERGRIELPMRLDPHDRPRQVVDQGEGKEARTDYQLIRQSGEHWRVALYPRSGRTHQLRVHASHPDGLDAPIVGDRLYGRPAERLMLHAEELRLVHPHTGKALQVRSPAPF